MAEEKEKAHELLIIKRHRGSHGGHHGGAWKIAFADFMTAMMALFLVLWLISATSEKTKVSIARYFNPVKLVDMSTMKKGVSDPNENISTNPDPLGETHPKKVEVNKAEEQRPDASAKDKDKDKGKDKGSDAAMAPQRDATHSEEALFRDPYAVLAEIVAAGDAVPAQPQKSAAKGKPDADSDNDTDVAEPFKDPFKIVIPDVLPNQAEVRKPAPKSQAQASTEQPSPSTTTTQPAQQQSVATPPGVQQQQPTATQKDATTPPPQQAQPGKGTQQQAPGPAATQAELIKQGEAAKQAEAAKQVEAAKLQTEAVKLRAEIATEIAKVTGKTGNDPLAPNIEVKASEEGILISLTDQFNYSMFAIGSAEPQARTIQVMDKIAGILKKYPGAIVIRGHTDGRPYRSANYDNWRLSSARAHMAYYMLTRSGLDEKRVEKIEGFADHKLKNLKDPLADENRRIEILLRKERT